MWRGEGVGEEVKGVVAEGARAGGASRPGPSLPVVSYVECRGVPGNENEKKHRKKNGACFRRLVLFS